MRNQTKLNRARLAVQVALIVGLALLILAALLGGMQGVAPARADPGTFYVDAVAGSDDSNCSAPADPCATIGYALDQAGNGDEIRVAQGTYLENLSVSIRVTLAGGYERVSWTRDLTQYETVIDGSGSQGASAQWGDPVVRFEGGSDGSALDGLTITGGSGQLAGGVHADGTDLTIRNCLIRDNSAHGGPDSQGGGGVVGTPGGRQLTIVNSRIMNNQASQGASGVRVHQSTLVMTNVLVADNHGDMGVNLNGDAILVNATVADNDGGIQLNTDGVAKLVITNSIIYHNGWSLLVEGNAVAEVAYSDIEGGWPGTGNIDADPRFVDAANSDYRLGVVSPCIDKGTSAGAPAADIEGTPRDLAPDMGAYEWTGFRVFLPLAVRGFGP